MTILSFTTDVAGQIGVKPRLVRIVATDALAAVSAAGFIKNSSGGVNNLEPTDVIHMIYSYEPTSGLGTFGIFRPLFSAGVITLVPWVDNADVLLPVVDGDIAIFNGVTGQSKTSGFNIASALLAQPSANSLTAHSGGGQGSALALTKQINNVATVAAPADSVKLPVSVAGRTITIINSAATNAMQVFGAGTDTINGVATGTGVSQAAGTVVNYTCTLAGAWFANPVSLGNILSTAIASPDTSPNLVSFNVTVGQAALASAGHVALITSSGAKQYKIKQLQINSGGTNFSGGGGDRLGQVSDGTTVYSVVPAASLQTLVNGQWGVTALPNPASAAINTSTAAGANLFFAYSGGATDYTAGSVVISGLAERVA